MNQNQKKIDELKKQIPHFNPNRCKIPITPAFSMDEKDPLAAEKAMFNEVFGEVKQYSKAPSARRPPLSGRQRASAGKTSDVALMASMTQRMNRLEKSNRLMNAELEKKNKEVKHLKVQLRSLQSAKGSDEETQIELTRLALENDKLKIQLKEMHKFLNDYGLVWVGNDATETKESDDSQKEFVFDFDRVFTQIKQLNQLAGKDKAQIVSIGERMKKLQFPRGIPLILYKDGIMLKRGPFRTYKEESTQQFVKDIIDGFFPFEFKDEFPDGVIFDAQDRRTEYFSSPARDRSGGMKLSTEEAPPMSVDKFLEKLPQKVLHKGEFIDVRDEVKQRLLGDKGEVKGKSVVVQTEALKEMVLDSNPSTRPLSARISQEVTTLQIRSTSGSRQTFVLRMRETDTIADVTKAVAEEMKVDATTVSLFSAFPRKQYNNPSVTLKSAGLSGNAMLLMQLAN
eukprot:TRINITY_DN778081_c0_g1_i1.p1 TRINITY_DN778081_c0_g1~~TRINITY_DN778081_c0_g1_i1.p1  ORF type:complete len:454 (-),score=115.56 TRINITY_DN778081_c0_g1_i1:210-1571(-)